MAICIISDVYCNCVLDQMSAGYNDQCIYCIFIYVKKKADQEVYVDSVYVSCMLCTCLVYVRVCWVYVKVCWSMLRCMHVYECVC